MFCYGHVVLCIALFFFIYMEGGGLGGDITVGWLE